MMKAAIHCHSTYSDGELTLSELRDLFVDAGYDLVCMTDHAEWFDDEKLRAYVDECERLSDSRFRFIAGLEFECERRMHILGYGVTSLVNSSNPENVISHIEHCGGVSVIAHPGDNMFPWIETFATLPTGIETWNSKYDGPNAPRPRTFKLLNRLQQRKPEMKAFYGQDLHWRNQNRGLTNLIDCELTRTSVLESFRSGTYRGRNRDTDLPASGELSVSLLAAYQRVSDQYMRKQKLFKRVKKVSGAVGKSLPAPVKSRIRKLFSE
jgi:predicted metal-dependent phosphoesterase TrpH